MINEVKIRELKKKRTDRFGAVSVKMKMYADDCDFYRDSEAKNAIKKAVTMIKKSTKVEGLTTNNKKFNYYYLDINSDYESDNFVDEIIKNLKYGNYRFIEYDIKNTKKELMDNYVNPISDKIADKTEYIKAVNLLAECERINRIDNFEKDLCELRKDLVSCLKYNNMIKSELEKER